MTNYADVPEASTLHTESETVQRALDVLNNGGTMLAFTVGSLPGAEPMAMPVGISSPAGTVQQATIDNLVAWLTQRQSDLTAQLAAIGVT